MVDDRRPRMRANASGGGRKKNKKNTVGRASSSKRTICLNANSQLHRPYFIELEEIQFPISVLCNREDKASERARGKEDSSCISIYVQISRIGCFFSFFFFPRNVTMEITDTTEKRGARVTRCKIENSYVSLSIILFHRPGGWSVSFLPLPHILRNRVISSRLIPRFQTRQCY